MRIAGRKELFDKIDEIESASYDTRCRILDEIGHAQSFFEGVHWVAPTSVRRTLTGGSQLVNNYNPDFDQVRVTDNFITSLAVRVRSQTFPTSIDPDVTPSDADTSSEGRVLAQLFEDLLGVAIDMSGYLGAAREANNARPIYGTCVIGLSLEVAPRTISVGGRSVTLPDRRIKAFFDSPHKLVLDPFQTSGDLRRHDWVMHRDIWTYQRAREVFGDAMARIDEKKCPTVGELANDEITTSRMSDRRMFAAYKLNSKSKGVLVRQLHCKGEDGVRFDGMYVVVDGGYNTATSDSTSKVWINEDEPVSPFGGDGLPMTLIHSVRRTDTPASIGEVTMVLDDQKRRNLNKTILFRQGVAAAALYHPTIDIRSLGTNDFETARQQWSNRVGGPLFYTSDKLQGFEKPSILPLPEPSAMLPNLADSEWRQAMEKVGRPPVTSGEQKSHVPFSVHQEALNQADMPGNVKVLEDLEAHASMLAVMAGTVCASVQMQSPGVLARLASRGFGQDDFAAMMQVDPNDLPVTIRVRSSSVRTRAHESRRADVFTAAQAGMVNPMDARMIFAQDLDIALSDDDKVFVVDAEKAARDVLAGMEWRPIPVGEYGTTYIKAFRRALRDRRAKYDTMATDRLVRAIEAQQQMNVQEAIRSDPELAVQAMAAQQAPALAEGSEAEDAQPVAVSDALTALSA